MTSLRLGFDTESPHPFLASLDGELESCVSLGCAQLSLLGVTGWSLGELMLSSPSCCL